MKKFGNAVKSFLIKHGATLAACAFAFVAISSNSSCIMPFYEPEEPAGLDKFKKFN